MRLVRGIVLALGIFLAAFALHIVGGATDQRWLFITAVVLIFLSAVLFPVLALLTSGRTRAPRREHLATFVIGFALTWSALWATSDRSVQGWQPFVAAAAVALASLPLLGFLDKWFKAPSTATKGRAGSKAARSRA